MTRIFDLRDIIHILYIFLPIRFFYLVASAQGKLAYHRNNRLRSIVRDNLATLMPPGAPDGKLDELTKAFFAGQASREMQRVLMTRLSDKKLEQILPITGLDNLDQALKKGKGVILYASHLNSASNFLLLQRLRHLGYDAQVAFPSKDDPFKPSRIGAWLNNLTGAKSVLEQIGAFYAQVNIRPVVKRLNNNSIIMILGDGTHSINFAKARFMDRDVFFTTGPIGLARMTGAALMFTAVSGNAPDNLHARLDAPLTVPATEDQEKDMAQVAQDYASRLEALLHDNVTQWQHLEFRDILNKMANPMEQSVTGRLKV